MLIIRRQQMEALAAAKREQFLIHLRQYLRFAHRTQCAALGEPEALARLTNRALEVAVKMDADSEPLVRHLSELLLEYPEASETEMASAWWNDASMSGELRIELLCVRIRGRFPKN